ncbi:DUF2938 domain-containing protein [Alteromonas sp. MMG017]|uniref:DUF2938 domain-containing protein n=1 Tax=Alteromonas sp. MMG017 TaxID=2822692 RepID=UPI001B3A481B|nr:DUF2938 domain-containing protein [Alteromonas sp. MMG017]MBQ4829424.1 DUF2938 domain-containing protein [Alteromonas sp. MMG017]
MINDFIYTFILIGIGGTIVLDIYAWLLATFFGFPATNWLLVGRWVGHMKSGQFIQPALSKAERIPGELIIGWVIHYLIGITYGLILMLCVNTQWVKLPTLLPSLLVSWVGIVAPFFIMMPGMGAGIAGAKTPNPTVTRIRSFAGHSVFGIGMFLTALAFA